jgi:hypothetical protein
MSGTKTKDKSYKIKVRLIRNHQKLSDNYLEQGAMATPKWCELQQIRQREKAYVAGARFC